jgi:DNA-directed RNA polymerase subunit RPC12/RpoP
MQVRCSRCGQEWPRDPALEVVCPNCRARIGVRCKRPSGHGGGLFTDFHDGRLVEAMRQGFEQRCPGADWQRPMFDAGV